MITKNGPQGSEIRGSGIEVSFKQKKPANNGLHAF